jgi:hypothetical protein
MLVDREPDPETQAMLTQMWRLQEAEENLNEWGPVVNGDTGTASLRAFQAEVLGCELYLKLVRDRALLEQFQSDETAAAFWQDPLDGLADAFGASIDIRPASLRARGLLRDPI